MSVKAISERTWIAVGGAVILVALVYGVLSKQGSNAPPANTTASNAAGSVESSTTGDTPITSEELDLQAEQEAMEEMVEARSARDEGRAQQEEEEIASSPQGRDSQADPGLPGERFPQTRTGRMSDEEIDSLSFEDARYAVNEAYARHGITFRRKEVREQFKRMSWYRPVPGRYYEKSHHRLTSTERANIDRLEQRLKLLNGSG